MAGKRHKRLATEVFDDRPVLEACATVVRQARKACRLSRRELGHRIGLSPSSIEYFEYAERWTTIPHLLHMAQVVGVPYTVLFPDEPTSSLTRLMHQLASCPPEVHAIISAWITGWAQLAPESLPGLCLEPDLPLAPDGEGSET